MTITTYLVAPVALTENTAQFIAQLLQTFITFLSLNTNAFTNVFFVNKNVHRRLHKLLQNNKINQCFQMSKLPINKMLKCLTISDERF